MSRVIDGHDILQYNSTFAIVMKDSLEKLLGGKKVTIDERVLEGAQRLFSVGMDFIRESNGLKPVHERWDERRESYASYRLLVDMLTKVRKIDEKEVNRELTTLYLAIQLLTQDGRQIPVGREQYKTLKDLFGEMHREAGSYCSSVGQNSPYSVGTFDDGDDD